jgi:hypothetical protein
MTKGLSPDHWIWERKRGFNYEGDPFHELIAMHYTGRIIAVILCPLSRDGFSYEVQFKVRVKGGGEDCYGDLEFFSERAARRFVENAFSRFNPFKAPRRPAAKRKRA